MDSNKRQIKSSFFYFIDTFGGIISVRRTNQVATLTQGLRKAKQLVTEGSRKHVQI